MSAITGIYFSNRQYYRDKSTTVRLTIETENASHVFTISEECLLTALRNDLNLEVKE